MPGLFKTYYQRLCSESNRIRLRRLRKAAEFRISRSNRPYKLHLGCGRIKIEGWINLDSDDTSASPDPDIVWDLRNGIPMESSSCEVIYSEHLLEHLAPNDGVLLLKECQRVLQPGGVVRIAMPSLDVLIKQSYEGDWKEQDWLKWPEYSFIETRAEMLNVAFRWWGHQWLYDREELHRRLREAGFSEICNCEWGESKIHYLKNLETRKDSL